jgi:hypothetical protein
MRSKKISSLICECPRIHNLALLDPHTDQIGSVTTETRMRDPTRLNMQLLLSHNLPRLTLP